MSESAESAVIEPDEDGWHLRVTTDFVEYDFLLPSNVVIDLAGPLISLHLGFKDEVSEPSQEAPRPRERYAELDDAYPLDDPKHPEYLAGADLARDIERGK